MSMNVGIVGSEAAKFTPVTEAKAREAIRGLLSEGDVVISGACHLGGIDKWAIEEADNLFLNTIEHPPVRRTWEGGYKQRNLLIAQDSDLVVCITVRELPATYTGMRFDKGCYHCGTPPEHHVKSGGCWTMKQAAKMGKQTKLIIIEA